VFGVRETPSDRILSPLKRRSLIQIPGRSAAVIQEDGGYDSRIETIACSYAKQEGVSLQRQVRLIAGWLSGVGELTYDYEPEMHYNAYVSAPSPTVKALEYAAFTLEFTINHPFAYETAQQLVRSITSGDVMTVETAGTVKTPVRLIIKNTGTTPISRLTIVSKFIEN